MKFDIKKIYSIIIFMIILSYSVFADGWKQTEFGNWQYEENGSILKATSKLIDGVVYYFDTKGDWIPRENFSTVKLSGKTEIVVELIGEDYENRNYNTKIKISMPIVCGDNDIFINEFIKDEFPNVIKKYFEDEYINSLFLLPEIEIKEMLEIYNIHDVLGFGYIGGRMFNVYLDYKNMKMWASKN